MFATHPLRRTLAAAATALVLVLAPVVVATSAAAATTGSVDLHNDTAEPMSDCPGDGYAYWHFVLSPNNGNFAFVTIVLNLDGTLVTFEGQAIRPNGTQADNVFVGVPAGSTLTSLRAERSYATYTSKNGEVPNQFNLSSVCRGTVPPTTTPPTTQPPPTTEVPPTTLPETTTTGPPEVLGTTTIAVEPTQPAEVMGETQELPYTGGDTVWLVVFGVTIAGAGFALATMARRRQHL